MAVDNGAPGLRDRPRDEAIDVEPGQIDRRLDRVALEPAIGARGGRQRSYAREQLLRGDCEPGRELFDGLERRRLPAGLDRLNELVAELSTFAELLERQASVASQLTDALTKSDRNRSRGDCGWQVSPQVSSEMLG